MKRILTVLSLLIALTFALYASEVVSTKTFTANLDLTEEDDIEFYFSAVNDHDYPLEVLSLVSDTSSLPALTGKGEFDIVWKAVSSKKFTIFIYSSALKTADGTTLDWTATDSKGNVILGRINGYGGSESNIVYTHDPSEKISETNDMKVSIKTEDISGKPFTAYSTTLMLELKMV